MKVAALFIFTVNLLLLNSVNTYKVEKSVLLKIDSTATEHNQRAASRKAEKNLLKSKITKYKGEPNWVAKLAGVSGAVVFISLALGLLFLWFGMFGAVFYLFTLFCVSTFVALISGWASSKNITFKKRSRLGIIGGLSGIGFLLILLLLIIPNMCKA